MDLYSSRYRLLAYCYITQETEAGRRWQIAEFDLWIEQLAAAQFHLISP